MPTLAHDTHDVVTRSTGETSRLLVTRRDPSTSSYRSVGILSHVGDQYEFAYLRSAVEAEEFRPLPGLSAQRSYSSRELFPVFASRVMSANRPDRGRALEAVGLGTDAEPFEILGRTGGRRAGDEIELIPLPEVDPSGVTDIKFLVHGIRHRPSRVHTILDTLTEGNLLALVPDPENEFDPHAVRVETRSGLHLGYVPMPLSDVVNRAIVAGDQPRAVIECRNGPEVGFHLRLLVRFQSTTVTESWTGPEWELFD